MGPRILATGLFLLASACGGLMPQPQGPQRSAVLDQSVRITAPTGYCVDSEISQPGRGFAFLAACALTDPEAQVALPSAIAIITVQVGAAGSATVGGSETDFRDFLRTDQGRTLLAAGDMGGPIEILSTDVGANLVRVYTRDLAPPTIVGTQGESWRAFTDIDGRTVTVTVRGLTEQPLSQARSRSLLDVALGNLTVVAPPAAS